MSEPATARATPVPTMALLLKLARFAGRPLAASSLLWVAFFGGGLAVGALLRAVFDRLSGAAPAGLSVWSLIALVVGVELARLLLSLAPALINVLVEFRLLTLLRANLLARILSYPGARALPDSPGEAVSRFRDDTAEVSTLLWWSTVVLGQVVFSVAALAIMARIEPRITLVILVPLVLVTALMRLVRGRVERYRRASRSATGAVTGFLGETLGAVQAVKLAGAEAAVLGEFRRLNDARRAQTVNDRVFSAVMDSLFFNIVSLGVGAILLLSAQAMRAGSFSVGDFALFVYYLEWVTELPYVAGVLMARYQQTGVAIERMLALLPGQAPEALVRPGPVYLRGELPAVPLPARAEADRLELLEARGLSYAHPGSGRGVAGVDLRLERGSFTVVTGRIGAGKSTLLRALVGLLPLDAGEVRWNGRRVEDPAAFFTPPRAAYTPQVPRLFSEPLRDNILLGLPAERVDLEAALALSVLDRDVATLEAGLDTVVGPRGVR
ncbi:MAG TPA: ABC transporter ATP-binding protein, partial [Chloroflexaceae bacterium]|nr:ABC transporter ATP-binding protein [Chloroflexaceae bacterium]